MALGIEKDHLMFMIDFQDGLLVFVLLLVHDFPHGREGGGKVLLSGDWKEVCDVLSGVGGTCSESRKELERRAGRSREGKMA